MMTRILTWYSILTIAFRCPSNPQLLADTSPQICKPYLTARDAILPHIEPYYEEYAAPYVETVRPYYNSIDNHVFTPITTFGKKYGAPRVAQAQDIAYTQWTKTVQPHLLKFGDEAKQRYDHTLAPYVDKVVGAGEPYYGVAKHAALQSYHENILPAYNAVKPHAVYVYGLGSDFVVDTGIPYTKWAWAAGAVFIERKIWPRVRILYGENVEPQLIRIGERLGRYRDGKRLKASIDEMEVSSSSLTIQTIIPTSPVSSTSTYSTVAHSNTPSSSIVVASSSDVSQDTQISPKQISENAKAIVTEDLKNWQERFAKAADEGSDELDERVTEITDTFIRSQAKGVGEALIIELEETVKSQINALKKTINSIVKRTRRLPKKSLLQPFGKPVSLLKIKHKLQEAGDRIMTKKSTIYLPHLQEKSLKSLITSANWDSKRLASDGHGPMESPIRTGGNTMH